MIRPAMVRRALKIPPFLQPAGLLAVVFFVTQSFADDGVQTDLLDEYLSVPGSFSFVRRAPQAELSNKIVLTVFEDFLCARCYEVVTELIPALRQKYEQRIEVRFRGMPIVHAASRIPARAYAISAELGLSEEMQQALFHARFEENIDTSSRDGVAHVADRIGLDPEILLQRLDAGGGETELERTITLSESYQVNSVPTVIVDGWIRVHDLSLVNMETILDELLARKP